MNPLTGTHAGEMTCMLGVGTHTQMQHVERWYEACRVIQKHVRGWSVRKRMTQKRAHRTPSTSTYEHKHGEQKHAHLTPTSTAAVRSSRDRDAERSATLSQLQQAWHTPTSAHATASHDVTRATSHDDVTRVEQRLQALMSGKPSLHAHDVASWREYEAKHRQAQAHAQRMEEKQASHVASQAHDIPRRIRATVVVEEIVLPSTSSAEQT